MSAGMIPDSLKKLGGKIGGTAAYPDAILRGKYAAKTPDVTAGLSKTGGLIDNLFGGMDGEFLSYAAAGMTPKKPTGGFSSVRVPGKAGAFNPQMLNVSPLQGNQMAAAPSAYKKRLLPHAAQDITYG